ncbi:MAG: hypothetical protein ABI609_03435 [Acidobacteriota bacterium]
MKKLAIVFGVLAVCLIAVAVQPVSAAAQAGTWSGWISDSHCGVKGAGEKHTKECVAKCAKDGKVQFVADADKKIYDIDKAHWDEAMGHAGHLVEVTGSMDNGAITITKIAATAPVGK